MDAIQRTTTRRAWIVKAAATVGTTFVARGASAVTVVSAREFGARGDGRSDDTAALLAWAAAVAGAQGAVTARIPAGIYPCSAELRIVTPGIRSFVLEAEGAELVVTAAAAESRRYLRIFNTAQAGELCRIEGITMRHNRPTVRSSNTDMLSIAGFAEYVLNSVTVASADNMGICIGRGDPRGYSPRSLLMRRPVVGGRYESEPHSHGTIGDSGIWVVNAPQRTEILDAKVVGTGDDGILVGHSHSSLAGECHILNVDVRDAGANGVLVAVPRGRITGKVDRTNDSGVALIRLDGAQGSDIHVQVDIRRSGRLQTGDIGRSMIRKRNPWGIWVWQGGQDGGNVSVEGSSIKDSHSSALVLQPYRDLSLARITGRLQCSDIATAAGAAREKAAVIRRAPTRGSVSNVDLSVDVARAAVPLVSWALSPEVPDEDIRLRISAQDCTVDPAFSRQPLVDLPGVPRRAALAGSHIEVTTRNCSFGDPVRVAPGALAPDARVKVR